MIRSYFFPRSMLRKSSIITLTPRSCRCCASSGLISTASIEKSPYFCSVLIMLPLPAPGSSTSIPPPQRENVEKCLDRRDWCRVEVVRLSGASSVCCTHYLPPYLLRQLWPSMTSASHISRSRSTVALAVMSSPF